MSRIPATTAPVAGYPAGVMAARTVQAPTTTVATAAAPAFRTSMPTTAARPATVLTGGVQGASVPATATAARPATVVTGATVQAAPRTVVAGAPTVGTPISSGVTVASGTARQARVISSGQPYSIQGQTTVAANYTPTALAPRVLQVGQPATVRPNTIAGPTYTQSAYEVKHKDDPQLQNLKELRKTCGLKDVPVGDGLQGFKKGASDGQLTRESFIEAYTTILQTHNIEAPSDEVKNAVFDLFDRDDNNVVDMMEVICGVSLLCSGGEDDKIHAVFEIFDENGDGFISMDEMFKFLSSVFKVVLTPNVMAVMNSMGVAVESPEDLASVTALECFKTADLNHDGRLSVAEFKNWFNAPRNDPSFLFSPVRKLLA